MAQKTYTELVADIVANCKRTNDATLVGTKLQDALKELCNRYDFPQLEEIDTVSTTASAQTTVLPTLFKGFYNEESVTQHETGKKQHLDIILPGEYFSIYPKPDEDTEAIPTTVTIFENLLYWYPIPDAVYDINLRYHKYHDTFDADNPHILGEQIDRALECYGTQFAYEAFQEYRDALYWERKGDVAMAKVSSRSMLGITTTRSPLLYASSGRVVTADKTDYGRVK